LGKPLNILKKKIELNNGTEKVTNPQNVAEMPTFFFLSFFFPGTMDELPKPNGGNKLLNITTKNK